jgi:hypothetical protein
MIRRKFLGLIAAAGVIFVISLFGNYWVVRKIFYRIEDFFKRSKKTPADINRTAVEIPKDAYSVSVELALNSRCTSDYDGNQYKFHWGMFDETKKLSDEQINRIVTHAKIPRFTDGRVEIRKKDNLLTFVIESEKAAILNDWMMVESGMQQQAVGLICAALGIGMVFQSSSKDGRSISDTDHENIKIKIDAMKPSYNDSYWTNSPPDGNESWRSNNLPITRRNGGKPLLSVLRDLKVEDLNGNIATQESISQLLWAARGRTPHLYKSKPWGMTIPTWGGEQNISSVYLVSRNSLSKYINWNKNRPAHELLECHKINNNLFQELLRPFSANQGLIVLGINENYARAFWEIGYQLLNLLLQAKALEIYYQAFLLNEAQKINIRAAGVADPVVVVSV